MVLRNLFVIRDQSLEHFVGLAGRPRSARTAELLYLAILELAVVLGWGPLGRPVGAVA